MLIGKHNHTIDVKGRLIIPSKFREDMGQNFILTKGIDQCLTAYEMEEWKSLQEKLSALPNSRKEVRQYRRHFLGSAKEVELDKQGRILVSSELREHAGLDKDVVVVGVMGRMEIWSKDGWDAQEASLGDNEIEEIAEKLAEMGFDI